MQKNYLSLVVTGLLLSSNAFGMKKEQPKNTSLQGLHKKTDVFLEIATNLEPKEIIALRKTSKGMSKLLKSPQMLSLSIDNYNHFEDLYKIYRSTSEKNQKKILKKLSDRNTNQSISDLLRKRIINPQEKLLKSFKTSNQDFFSCIEQIIIEILSNLELKTLDIVKKKYCIKVYDLDPFSMRLGEVIYLVSSAIMINKINIPHILQHHSQIKKNENSLFSSIFNNTLDGKSALVAISKKGYLNTLKLFLKHANSKFITKKNLHKSIIVTIILKNKSCLQILLSALKDVEKENDYRIILKKSAKKIDLNETMQLSCYEMVLESLRSLLMKISSRKVVKVNREDTIDIINGYKKN